MIQSSHDVEGQTLGIIDGGLNGDRTKQQHLGCF
jgi:hypothetical protein